MRWNAPLCLALLLSPASARAQADDPLPETAPDEATDRSADPPEETWGATVDPVEESMDPAAGNPGGEGGAEQARPPTTSTVTINAREAELRREQE